VSSYFITYEQSCEAYDARCGTKLTLEYGRERIRALYVPNEPSAAECVKCYGKAYLRQVIQWLERTTREA
jgi:hypothetical protein